MTSTTDTLVLYHANCPDGFGAALAAWLKFGNTAEYVPVDYGDSELPDVTGKNVYILDFSYKKPVLAGMGLVADSIILLDHHTTAETELSGFSCQCGHVHIDTSKSGARLAWEHFFPGTEVPALILHIEDRDLWKFAIPGTNEFLAYLDTLPFDFAAWAALLDEESAELAEARDVGEILHKQSVRSCEQLAKDAVPLVIGEHLGAMVSCGIEHTSMVGDILAKRTGTFAAIWRVEPGERIKVSLRSIKPFDVEKLALQFGGGGHPQAASFRIPSERVLELVKGELLLPLSPSGS